MIDTNNSTSEISSNLNREKKKFRLFFKEINKKKIQNYIFFFFFSVNVFDKGMILKNHIILLTH